MVPRTIHPTRMLQPRVKDFQVWKVLRGIVAEQKTARTLAVLPSLPSLRREMETNRSVGAGGISCPNGDGPTIWMRRRRSQFALFIRLQRQAAITRISSEARGR